MKHRLLPNWNRKPPGTAPGTLVAPDLASKPVVTVVAYTKGPDAGQPVIIRPALRMRSAAQAAP